MAEIGATLREARMRAHIDISEIEAQTKIRAKYLRALENEEWDLLPGPTYVTSFLRTYARALGLDSKQIVEEYRSTFERGSEPEPPLLPPSRRNRRDDPPSRGLWRRLLLIGMAIVVVLLVVDLATNALSGSPKKHNKHPGARTTPLTGPSGVTSVSTTSTATATQPLGAVISLKLIPTAPVFVCLVARNNRELVAGLVLQPGAATRTFRSRHFYLSLSNGSVRLFIDGTERKVPHSSNSIGYSITKAGRHRVPVSTLPTCG